MTEDSIVVIGAGLAGGKAVEAARDQGFTGRVTLISEESHLPYERPPLSKEYLAGKKERSAFDVHGADWYSEHDIDVRLGTSVTAIDTAAHQVQLDDGSTVSYGKLLLATGSTPRKLTIPGATADGVLYLRSVEDSDLLKRTIAEISRLVVIGGGWIGLEITAAARNAGVEVTVLEAAKLPLLAVLGSEVAQVFADLHTAHGVDLRCGVQVAEITTDAGKANGVRLADGTVIEADAVVVGIGAIPNTELASAAGLTVSNGVTVDASLRTNDPDIFAAGDIANAFHPVLNQQVRVEHWANALNQPQVAVAGMLGQTAVYERLPYFYTDQYDLSMEYLGYVEPKSYDQVLFRGDVATREFIAFWLSEGRVLAGMNANVWDVSDAIGALILSRAVIDPKHLTDPTIPLTELAG